MNDSSSRARTDASQAPSRFRRERTLQDWATYVERFAPNSRVNSELEHELEVALHEGDALADAVVDAMHGPDGDSVRRTYRHALAHGAENCGELPEPVRALFEQLDRTPHWLDRNKLALGADTLLRSGLAGSFALGAVSLVGGYLFPGPTKPLAVTGRFSRMAPRRAAETAKFITDIAQSRGLERFSDGFKTTIHVRMMHAFVRRHIRDLPTWQQDVWGLPVNQHDMLVTTLLFSVAFIYGVERFGLHLTADEREALNHLWRYVGRLLGVRDDLLPETISEATARFRLLTTMQTGPDADSRELTKAFLEVPRSGNSGAWQKLYGEFEARVLAGFARDALGARAADLLGVPDDPWKFSPAVLSRIVQFSELLRRVVPGGQRFAIEWYGTLAVQRVKERLGSQRPAFEEQRMAHA